MTTQAETTASRACIGMSCSITLLMAVAADAQVQLHELPLSFPSGCNSSGSLLSGDGAVVIGTLANGKAGLWRLGSGVIEMGDFCPTAISQWGSAVAGIGSSGAVVYSVYSATLHEVSVPEGQSFSPLSVDSPNRASGFLTSPSTGMRAAFWTLADGLQLVPGIPEDQQPSAINSSADFIDWSVLAGNVQGFDGKRGFVHWRTGSQPLSTVLLSGPDVAQCWAWDVDRNGLRVVGQVPFPGQQAWVVGIPNRACVWQPSGQDYLPSLLRQLPGTDRSDARGSSEYAEVIVGTCYGADRGYRATAWAGFNRPIDLTHYLECAGVATPTLTLALRVSDDGSRILVYGNSRFHLITGFTPPPGPITDLNWDRNTDGIDLGLLLSAWGPCPSPCDADLNRDGAVDGNDLAQLLAKWGSCP